MVLRGSPQGASQIALIFQVRIYSVPMEGEESDLILPRYLYSGVRGGVEKGRREYVRGERTSREDVWG